MRRKAGSKTVPQLAVPAEVLSPAGATFEPKPRKTFRCRVCGAEGATEQSDLLCWVCRRLKISAWRDGEQQLPAAE